MTEINETFCAENVSRSTYIVVITVTLTTILLMIVNDIELKHHGAVVNISDEFATAYCRWQCVFLA